LLQPPEVNRARAVFQKRLTNFSSRSILGLLPLAGDVIEFDAGSASVTQSQMRNGLWVYERMGLAMTAAN